MQEMACCHMTPGHYLNPCLTSVEALMKFMIRSNDIWKLFSTWTNTSTHWPLWDVEESVYFKLISRIDNFSPSNEIGLWWVPQIPIDDKWTLVWVIARCHQMTCHCLSQCLPRSVSWYGITRPQWVNGHFMPSWMPGSRDYLSKWCPIKEVAAFPHAKQIRNNYPLACYLYIIDFLVHQNLIINSDI